MYGLRIHYVVKKKTYLCDLRLVSETDELGINNLK